MQSAEDALSTRATGADLVANEQITRDEESAVWASMFAGVHTEDTSSDAERGQRVPSQVARQRAAAAGARPDAKDVAPPSGSLKGLNLTFPVPESPP